MTRSRQLFSCAAAAVLVLAASPAALAQHRDDWCPEPEARQFDFWLGEWDVQNHNRPPNGDRWFETGRATDRVYTVLGGCAVVEHWRGYAFPQAGHIVGFSVRAWNPAAESWEAALLWPIGPNASFGTPSGGADGDDLVLRNQFEGSDGSTVLSRLLFTDIDDDAFTWMNGISHDGGDTWQASWRMDFTRRPATAAGLWNGPSMSTERCPQPAYRTFDRYLGEWTGTRIAPGNDSTDVRTWLVRILEGCAVMVRTWTEDGSWERFAVRAYDANLDRWVEYSLASDARALRRSEWDPHSGERAFAEVEPVDGVYTRVRWTSDDGGLQRIVEEAPAADGPWTQAYELRFTQRVAARQGP
ncbi:MAG: hypothetical protein PVF05_08075 [Gemmatimonadales bacterium]|jgi:hypothetical protein